MAITQQELTAAPAGTQFTLDKKFKDYAPGTVVTLEKLQPVQGVPMAMVTGVPGERSFAVPFGSLTFAGAASQAAADESPPIDGPVWDFFANWTNLEDEATLNFVAKYIETMGREDLSVIEGDMNAFGIPVAQGLTRFQTCQLAQAFYNSFGLPADSVVDSVVNAGELVAPPAAAPTPAPTTQPVATTPAPTTQPVATPAAAVTPTPKPKAAAVEAVDKPGWTAAKMGAMRILGALAPLYAEDPGNFNTELALAVKMLGSASKVS